MNNFENDVREALSEFETQPPLDPVAVVKRGKRIRNRRRAMVGLAAAGMVAVVGGISIVPKLGTSTVTTANPDASPSVASVTSEVPVPVACPPQGTPRGLPPGQQREEDPFTLAELKGYNGGPDSAPPPAGDVVCTGRFTALGEVVFWGAEKGMGMGSTFSIWQGRRDPITGVITSAGYTCYSSGFSTTKNEHAPGFHALSGGFIGAYLYGYYVGPIASFSLTFRGKPLPTGTMKWSAHPEISIVWAKNAVAQNALKYSPKPGTEIFGNANPGDLVLKPVDAAGQPLAVGDTGTISG